MTSQPRTPGVVAKLLDVSPDTIRRYAATYAAHLSPGANPARGQPRTFTAEDIATLQIVREAMQAGHSTDEIAAMLGSVTLPPAVDEDVGSDALVPLHDKPESVLALMHQLSSMVDRLDERDARVAHLAAEVADLRSVIDDQLRAAVGEIPVTQQPVLAAWVQYTIGIAVVVIVLVAVAVVVWLLR